MKTYLVPKSQSFRSHLYPKTLLPETLLPENVRSRQCSSDFAQSVSHSWLCSFCSPGFLALLSLLTRVVGFALFAHQVSWLCSPGFARVAVERAILDEIVLEMSHLDQVGRLVIGEVLGQELGPGECAVSAAHVHEGVAIVEVVVIVVVGQSRAV
jgi:hypothetical protein